MWLTLSQVVLGLIVLDAILGLKTLYLRAKRADQSILALVALQGVYRLREARSVTTD